MFICMFQLKFPRLFINRHKMVFTRHHHNFPRLDLFIYLQTNDKKEHRMHQQFDAFTLNNSQIPGHIDMCLSAVLICH